MTASAGGNHGRGEPRRDAGCGRELAGRYALELLGSQGFAFRSEDLPPDEVSMDAASDWAGSGAMHLTGMADGPTLPAPGAVATCMRGAAQALALLSERLGPCLDGGGSGGRSRSRPTGLDGPALLGERAALAQPEFTRRGGVSAGGSCRLLRARDGFIALNLARPSDVSVLPAWLEDPLDDAASAGESTPRLHDALTRVVKGRSAQDLADRAQLLGLPVACAGEIANATLPWCHIAAHGPTASPLRRPFVVDLSSLWAGPLAGQLLAACGADVVKVESVERPDGARRGRPAFFDLMNGEKRSVAFALSTPRGVAQLRALLARADIVIESSRPRALAQLGLDASSLVAARPGVTWLSITGYGRAEPRALRVAFGDDAAVAAGLHARTADGTPVFCGDAIADPLTGLHAAVAALASFLTGGGRLLDVSLVAVAAKAANFGKDEAFGPNRKPVRPPRARRPKYPAAALGRDTRAVLAELEIDC